jgi:hypothetical protein
MYAVIYKNRVLVGPMNWNRAMFQGALKKQQILVGLPRTAPNDLPLIINDDARIAMVEQQRPELNPMVEYYHGPRWDLTGDRAIANYDVVDTPVEFAKTNFRELAAAERYNREVAGVQVEIQGTWVTCDTSREGRSIFLQAYSTLPDGDSINWKFPQGWFMLSKMELGQVVQAGVIWIQQAFEWEKDINDQIDAATTKAQLLAIQILPEPPPESVIMEE